MFMAVPPYNGLLDITVVLSDRTNILHALAVLPFGL
jgi:hypothetical protein